MNARFIASTRLTVPTSPDSTTHADNAVLGIAPKKALKARMASKRRNVRPSKTTKGKKVPPQKSAASAHCLLLELPPELRNEIYQYAAPTPAGFGIGESKLHSHACGLVLTCRQIRREALPVFKHYIKTEHLAFNARVHDYEVDSLTSFLEKLEPLQDASEQRSLALTLCFTRRHTTTQPPGIRSLQEWLKYCSTTRVVRDMVRTYDAQFDQAEARVLVKICYVLHGIRELVPTLSGMPRGDCALIEAAVAEGLERTEEQTRKDEVKALDDLW